MTRNGLVLLGLTVVVVAVSAPAVSASRGTTPECMGEEATIVGTSATETLRGTEGVDVIVGGGSSGTRGDKVYGLGGNDVICVTIEAVYTRVRGGDGDDQVRGTGRMYGGPGDDRLIDPDPNDGLVPFIRGGKGDDVLRSRANDINVFVPGPGNDSVLGARHAGNIVWFPGAQRGVMVDMRAGTAQGQGDDTFRRIDAVAGSNHPDFIFGDARSNWLIGGRGDDHLVGRDGGDSLEGSKGDDRATGGPGNDDLDGDDGRDNLFGRVGDDSLDGDNGVDALYGSSGNDELIEKRRPEPNLIVQGQAVTAATAATASHRTSSADANATRHRSKPCHHPLTDSHPAAYLRDWGSPREQWWLAQGLGSADRRCRLVRIVGVRRWDRLGALDRLDPELVSRPRFDLETTAASTAAPPRVGMLNTVMVIVDDMRSSELWALPRTRSWLAGNGVRFSNAYAPTPLCCPARATILTGQYAHNTGVFDNQIGGFLPGGVMAFDDDMTLATQLSASGIRTGYIGKYLNQYQYLWVPPGWSDWRAGIDGVYIYRTADGEQHIGYNEVASYEGLTTYNMNGAARTLRGYETTVQTELARGFIRRNAEDSFYLQLNYLAPHVNVDREGVAGPPIPHEDHAGAFDGYSVPRTRAYNELVMSDKPDDLQRPRMNLATRTRLDALAQARLETLQSVDDGMVAIRRALAANGVLARTNVIFVSDNGLILGEHRIPNHKIWGYEPSARVPLLMAGPSVDGAGIVNPTPVGLHDLASTITTWHGLGPMPAADGVALSADPIPQRDLLLQGTFEENSNLSYTGLRTAQDYVFLEYGSGSVELYDLATDPTQLHNLAEEPAYQQLRLNLTDRLARLRHCAGTTCR